MSASGRVDWGLGRSTTLGLRAGVASWSEDNPQVGSVLTNGAGSRVEGSDLSVSAAVTTVGEAWMNEARLGFSSASREWTGGGRRWPLSRRGIDIATIRLPEIRREAFERATRFHIGWVRTSSRWVGCPAESLPSITGGTPGRSFRSAGGSEGFYSGFAPGPSQTGCDRVWRPGEDVGGAPASR